LWFIDLYLNNYSTAAIIEKREQIKQGYVTAPKPKSEVAAHPKLKAKPAPAPEPAVEKPQTIVVSAGETVKIQNTVLKSDPIVEEPKPETVVEPVSESVIESIPKTIAKEEPAILVEEIQPKASNHEQLMAWIEEEEEGGEDNV